MDYFGIKT